MDNQTLFKATFNPSIKNYTFTLGVLFLIFTFIGIPLLLFWILGLGKYTGERYYNSLSCTLTNHHLEFQKGVFFKVEKTIPLENIQDLTFIQNPILNFFDLKILKIETAGNSQSSGADMKLVGIIDADNFKKRVLKQRELLQTKEEQQAMNTSNETNLLLREIKDLIKQQINR